MYAPSIMRSGSLPHRDILATHTLLPIEPTHLRTHYLFGSTYWRSFFRSVFDPQRLFFILHLSQTCIQYKKLDNSVSLQDIRITLHLFSSYTKPRYLHTSYKTLFYIWNIISACRYIKCLITQTIDLNTSTSTSLLSSEPSPLLPFIKAKRLLHC